MKKDTKEKYKYKNFFRIFTYFKNYKLNFAIYFSLAIVSVALSFLELIVMGNVLANLGQFNVDALIYLFAIYLVLQLLIILIKYFSVTFVDRMIIKIITDIRLETLQYMMNVKTSVFDRNKSGKFKERILNDGNEMIWSFIEALNSVLEILASILFIGYIFTLNIYIGLLLVVFVAIYFFVDKGKTYKFIKNHRRWKSKADSFNSYGIEIIKGVRDVKVLNAKPSILTTFASIQEDFYKDYYKRNVTNHKYWAVLRAISTIFFLFTIGLGIYLVTINQFTLAGVLIVYSSYDRIKNVTSLFSTVREKVSTAEIAAERAFEIHNHNSIYEKESFGEIKLLKAKGKIEFKNVDFGYKKDKLIYNKLNLIIQPAQTIGIVGDSGGGKSTLLNLISKLYDVSNGEIMIDGVNINNIAESSIRDTVTYVTQQPYLFDDTILNNILISKPNLTLDHAISVCKLANINDYIMSLPNGYNTIVGENGVQLSGGQRQRIAIARALINNSKIILFDEATSALDNESQNIIKSSLKTISKNRTVMIVAHRLSTIKDCDRILMFKGGKIVADGTHNNLIQTNNHYKKLYNSNLENE